MEFKGTNKLAYYKENAEENYLHVPISVLRYISELETHIEKSYATEMLEILKRIYKIENGSFSLKSFDVKRLKEEIQQLIKKATEL
jgi:hypothetical protein